MKKKLLVCVMAALLCTGVFAGCGGGEGTPAVTDGQQETSQTEVSSEEISSAPQTDFTAQQADGNVENGMLIVNQNDHWRGLELFGGGSGDNYVAALKSLKEKVGDDVKLYSMPAPLASEFYTPSNFAEYNASQKECFDSIAARLGSDVISVDAVTELTYHTEEDIYCRTDHHWQPLGAYYAAKTFANAAGVPFADLSTYTKTDVEGFVGSLYAFSGDSKLLNDAETFTYYEPSNSYTTDYYDTAFNHTYSGNLFVETDTANSYLRFMGGDEQVVKIKTDVNNGRKLLVVKDSYGNAEIPFYTGSFEEIYVLDMRYFQRNLVNFIDAMDISDVLFTCAAYSVVGQNADNLNNLITQDATSTITDDAAATTTTN